MNRNIFKSKKNELVAIIRDALVKGLPPLFRVHRGLLKRTNPATFEVSCSLNELAQSLGYKPSELQTILEDLSILNFIEYQVEGKGDKNWKIKILVH
jgi:hypothetical protein